MNRQSLTALAAFVVYLGLLIAPLVIGFLSPAAQALPRRPIWDDLGSALAMVGFAAVLVEFVLLGRFRPLSTSLGSDFLMQAHQLFARTALAFLVLHPFLYSLWGESHHVSDTTYVYALKISGGSLLTGFVALTLLIVLVVLAIRRSKSSHDYDHWRKWHAIWAAAVIVLGLHHTLDAGRYSAFTSLWAYWWVIFGVSVASIATVYVIRPWLQKNAAYTITSVNERAKDTFELVITPRGPGRLRFKAGQFAWLKVGSTRVTLDHPFSIASSPKPSGEIHFLIKAVGDFTRGLFSASTGTPAYLDGPHGHFQIPKDAKSVVMIAGGIGVAPFCGLIEDCANQGDSRPIRLIYGNRLQSQEVNVSELTGSDRLENFALISVVGEPEEKKSSENLVVGQLSSEVLEGIFKKPGFDQIRREAIFMICGPAVMIDAVEASLVELGIPLSRIISEKFQYDFNLKSPKSRRTLAGWVASSVILFGAALAATFLARL